MQRKAYFIGIAGKTMAPLAKAFKDMQWEVSGSDKEKVYPPVTDFLLQNKISYHKSYKKENLSKDADLVIVGRSALLVDKDNPEYLEALSLKLNVLSYPEVLSKYLIKENSIVVTGTNGKSTTTALITWILINAGLNPSYMFGGIPLNFSDGTKISDSKYSVIEGDETPSLKEIDPSKFMFYKPKYLLITSTEYDHPEVFKSNKEYLNAYVNLVKLLPDDGMLFYDSNTVNESVIGACRCKKVAFQTTDTSFLAPNILFKESSVRVKVLCLKLNIDEKIIDSSILSFKGLKGRNEFLGEFEGRYLYHDLSQQSSKVKNTLSLLRSKYRDNNLVVIFDPSATSLKFKESLKQYRDSFIDAGHIVVAKVNFISDVSGEDRVTGPDLVEAFGGTGKVTYVPVNEKIIEWIVQNTKEEDIVVFMSSGGLEFTKLIEEVKKELGGQGE